MDSFEIKTTQIKYQHFVSFCDFGFSRILLTSDCFQEDLTEEPKLVQVCFIYNVQSELQLVTDVSKVTVHVSPGPDSQSSVSNPDHISEVDLWGSAVFQSYQTLHKVRKSLEQFRFEF